MDLRKIISKGKRKGQVLPVFFQKIMLIGLVAGVVMWMIYSSINSEEVTVIMRQERNNVELWHQVLKSDIFRADSEGLTSSATNKDYKSYFSKEKIEYAFSSTNGGGDVGDISCSFSSPLSNCLDIYPNLYYLNIEFETNEWLFSNDDSWDYITDDTYTYKETISVIEDTDSLPNMGLIYFRVELFE